jgi:hypothetical protein
VIQLKKNMMYIIVAVLVVVIIIAGAAAYVLSTNGNSGTNASPTPTPAPAATVVGANTLQFSVNETTNGATVNYLFACKNFNTSTELIRIDIPSGSGNYSYIIKAGEQKSYTNQTGTWTQDSTFDPSSFATAFTNHVDKLAAQGNTNDLTYTSGSSTFKIYCVAVNPTLADSFFAVPS